MRDEMRRGGDILAGLLLGAGAMYLLDPDRGTRRRALMRDRAIHLGHTLERLVSDVLDLARGDRDLARPLAGWGCAPPGVGATCAIALAEPWRRRAAA